MVDERPDPAAQITALQAQQRAVADLGLLALRERSLPTLFDEAARLVREALSTDFSKLLELRSDELLVTAGSGWPEGVVGRLELPASGESQAAYALRTRRPVIVPDLPAETRFHPEQVFLDLGVRSGVNVVIEGAERPFGVLEVDSRVPREYTASEIAFLQLVANIVSSSVERQALDEDRERFLSLAAHELRSPLTSILGFSRRALRRIAAVHTEDRELAEALETVHHSATRLQQTVAKLSELAELGGSRSVEREPVNLTRLLHELVLDTQQRYRSIEFSEASSIGDAIVHSDASLLGSTLRNILDNAAKYSPPGSRVHAELELSEEDAVIRVRDSCGGLGETKVSRLFEPYYRGAPSQAAPGLGVGLFLVSKAATALGGEIAVHDLPGEGCEFALRLPRD